MLTLVSNQQKTTFTINGATVATGKIVGVLVPNRPLTITAKPEGYIEKEDYIQPPFHDNSQIGFYFLKEDRLAANVAEPQGTPPVAPPQSSAGLLDVDSHGGHEALASREPIAAPSRPAQPIKHVSAPSGPAIVHSGSAPNADGRRVALVIGNSRYEYVPALSNPSHDAELMAATLRSVGFKLVGDRALIDLDKPAFESAVQRFGDEAEGSNIALFYYAGHGLELNGANYLAPVSTNPTKEADVALQMVEAQSVLRQMEDSGAKLNVVILDACRNNPFAGRGLRATNGGLGEMQAPTGTLISYATQPGEVAGDGSGRDSPFTQALAEAIPLPGVDILLLFNKVAVTVQNRTGGNQQPWTSHSPIDGEFQFTETPAQNEVMQ